MVRRAIIAGVLVALSVASAGAQELRKGAMVEVPAGTIWFRDASRLARWQGLKKSGNDAALAAYQQQVLASRDAWQFTNPLTVKVLDIGAGRNLVRVEMLTPGRMLGTTWLVDAGAVGLSW